MFPIHTVRLLVLLLLIVGGPAYGRDAGVKVSLAQAIDEAIARHPTRRYTAALDLSARRSGEGAGRWLGPTPSISTRFNTDSVANDIGEEEWEVMLNLPLVPPAERSARRELADRESSAVLLANIQFTLQVAGEVRRHIMAVRRATLDVELAEKALASAQALEIQLQRLVDAGDRPRAELLLANAVALERENALIDARAELQHSQWRWHRLTGLSSLPATETVVSVPDDHDRLIKNHPTLRWLESELSRARAKEKLQSEKWTQKPVFGVGYRGERPSVSEREIRSLGLFFQMPLDFGGYNTRDESQSIRERGAAEMELAVQRRQLLQTLHDAELFLDTAERSLAVAEARELAATEADRLAQLRFNHGAISLSELLATRDRALAASAERARRALAKSESISQFNQATGVIPE